MIAAMGYRSRLRLVLPIVLGLLAVGAALAPGVLAAPPVPVVTTPTPVPTATPRVVPPSIELLALPEAQRAGRLRFIPLALNDSRRRGDLTPDAYSYEVQPGDTLWTLALDSGRDLDTMSCATTPTGSDAEKLTPGQTITVPALDDLCYTAIPGDTLQGIAARHGVSVQAIVDTAWNGFSAAPFRVEPRRRILIPGARQAAKPRPEHADVSVPSDAWSGTQWRDWRFGDGKFVWPVEGRISQGARRGHTAIDIAVPLGTPVMAADRGTVVYAGWNPTGYGFRVVIDHGIDYLTLYAHLSDIYVEAGQVVGKGQVIGASGANGNVTGPHLHFEIRDFGRLVDPLKLLP
jgi:LysM repeat protein